MKFMRDTHLNANANANARMSLGQVFGESRVESSRVECLWRLSAGRQSAWTRPNIAPLSFLILIKESFWTKVPAEAFLLPQCHNAEKISATNESRENKMFMSHDKMSWHVLIGGASLLSMQAVERMSEEWGVGRGARNFCPKLSYEIKSKYHKHSRGGRASGLARYIYLFLCPTTNAIR